MKSIFSWFCFAFQTCSWREAPMWRRSRHVRCSSRRCQHCASTSALRRWKRLFSYHFSIFFSTKCLKFLIYSSFLLFLFFILIKCDEILFESVSQGAGSGSSDAAAVLEAALFPWQRAQIVVWSHDKDERNKHISIYIFILFNYINYIIYMFIYTFILH